MNSLRPWLDEACDAQRGRPDRVTRLGMPLFLTMACWPVTLITRESLTLNLHLMAT
jgi:hypothetical protein